MPRRSTADLNVVRPVAGFSRLRPPSDLGKEEAAVWRQVVLACDAKHFQQSDAPLLARYCESVILARRAAAALADEGPVVAGRTNPWLVVQEKAIRAMVALSMRLRISRQSRMRREGTGPKGPPASIYELMRQADAEDEGE
jgi:P27 family predicted phage terminase small subunit